MKKLFIISAALCLLLLAGCGKAPSYAELETQLVESEYGFSFTVPQAWQQLDTAASTETAAETTGGAAQQQFTQYHFSSGDGTMTLLVLAELGGMEYDTSIELCETLADNLLATVFGSGDKAAVSGDDQHCRQQLSGADTADNPIVCVVDVWHPYTAVRYYMIFTATQAAYKENAYIVTGIEDSFTVTMAAEDMYQLIQDQRDAELTQPTTEITENSGEQL